MPNGGMMPCCLVCAWADEKDLGVPSKVLCTKHQVTIHDAMALFCSELSEEAIERERFLDDVMYMWAMVIYQNPKWPTLPQYYHEPVSLIPISKYKEWDEETCSKEIRERNKEVEEAFWKKYGRED